MHRSFFHFCICVSLLALLGCLTSGSASAQTLTVVHQFGDYTEDGQYPSAALVQGNDGNFYGTTFGGTVGAGTVFKITPPGVETILHQFHDGTVANDGADLVAALVQGSDGNFYGTTEEGGTSENDGTVFKITPSGLETVLHRFFDGTVANDGAAPLAALVQGTDGNFYGTTLAGGASNNGTIFKITPAGVVTILYGFSATSSAYPNGNSDGTSPSAALILGPDGNFYGTASFGGANGTGTVFKITPTGTFTTLHSFSATATMLPFSNSDGADPNASLALGSDGNFYGTTANGGAAADGTVFKITPSGVLTSLYQFSAVNGNYENSDGAEPNGIVYGRDGNFYGTTYVGGPNGTGTIFTITPSGTFTSLYSFSASNVGTGVNSDGAAPVSALIRGSDGNFYGTASEGGSAADGTAFKLVVSSSPSPPTVTGFMPTRGPIGTVVTATGTNLNGVTAVRFHNANATTFSANAAGTQLTVTVPSGAGTGTFTVTTPGGSVKTTGTFTVVPPPTVTSFTPTSGPVGTVVTVSGTNLNGVTAVRFHNANAKVFSVNGAGTQLTVTVPTGAGTGTFTVTTPGGSVKTTGTFTVH